MLVPRRSDENDDSAHGLTEEDYRGDPFRGIEQAHEGAPESLTWTRPDGIRAVHPEYQRAGALGPTNTTASASPQVNEPEAFAERLGYKSED